MPTALALTGRRHVLGKISHSTSGLYDPLLDLMGLMVRDVRLTGVQR